MIKCGNCGIELDDETKLCPNCGNNLEGSEKVQEQKEKDSKQCPNCGALVAEDAFICPECGNKIAEIKMSKKCPKCNSELDIDAQFCDSCGFNLNSSSNQVQNVKNSIENSNENTNAGSLDINEAISNINYVKLAAFSIISLIIAIVLTLIFMYIVQATTNYGDIPNYPVAYFIALLISVVFISSYQNNIVEGGLLGLIVGLLLGILEYSIAGLYFGNSFGYELFFESNTLTFVILGVIFGFLANMFLKGKFTKYFDLNQFIKL